MICEESGGYNILQRSDNKCIDLSIEAFIKDSGITGNGSLKKRSYLRDPGADLVCDGCDERPKMVPCLIRSGK